MCWRCVGWEGSWITTERGKTRSAFGLDGALPLCLCLGHRGRPAFAGAIQLRAILALYSGHWRTRCNMQAFVLFIVVWRILCHHHWPSFLFPPFLSWQHSSRSGVPLESATRICAMCWALSTRAFKEDGAEWTAACKEDAATIREGPQCAGRQQTTTKRTLPLPSYRKWRLPWRLLFDFPFLIGAHIYLFTRHCSA